MTAEDYIIKESYRSLAKSAQMLTNQLKEILKCSEEYSKNFQEFVAVMDGKKRPVDFETISKLAKKKAADGKSAEVKAVITECGVKKLSDIPQEHYEDVFKKLEAI